MKAPCCACKLLHVNRLGDCPNESAVACYVCGSPLCGDCTTGVLTDAGFVRICTPVATPSTIDRLCFRAIQLRGAYSQVVPS